MASPTASQQVLW